MFSVLINSSCSTWWAPNCRQNQLVLVLLQLSMQNPLMLNSQCNAAAALQPLTWSHFHGDNVSQPACADLKKKQTRGAASLNLPLPVNNLLCVSTDWSISHFIFCFIFLLLALFGDVLYHNMKLILQRTVFVSSSNHSSRKQKNNNFQLSSVDFTVFWVHPQPVGRCWLDGQLLSCRCRWFWPHHQKPHKSTGYRCHGNRPRCTGGRGGGEGDVTGDHVTRADSPYIVTLKASDKRAGAV